MNKSKKKIKQSSNSQIDEDPSEYSLVALLDLAIAGVFYISETDACLKTYEGQKVNENSPSEILRQIGNSEDRKIEERDFAEFFDRLTNLKDWFGDEEIRRAERFLKIRKLLEDNLRDLKVFRLGEIKIDIFIVGIDSQNILKGLKTFAVET